MKDKYITIKIRKQGAVLLNYKKALVIKDRKDIVLLLIDLKSKYIEEFSIHTYQGNILKECGLLLSPTDRSLYLHKYLTNDTEIYFPDYAGWKIMMSSSSRYSIYVCLIKES